MASIALQIRLHWNHWIARGYEMVNIEKAYGKWWFNGDIMGCHIPCGKSQPWNPNGSLRSLEQRLSDIQNLVFCLSKPLVKPTASNGNDWSCFKNMYRLKTGSNRFWFNTKLQLLIGHFLKSMAVHQRDDDISHFFGAAVRINSSAPSLFSQRHPCRWNCRCGHTCWKMKDPEKRRTSIATEVGCVFSLQNNLEFVWFSHVLWTK